MLKLFYDYVVKEKGKKSMPILNSNNEKQLIYANAIDYDSPAANRLREDLKKIAANKGETFDNAVNTLVLYKTSYWHFDHTAKPDIIIRSLSKELQRPFSVKKKDAVQLTDDANRITVNGEDVSIESSNRNVLTPKDITKVIENYKELIYGIHYIYENLVKRDSKKLTCVRLLYCKWLHMINKNQDFLRKGMLRGNYKNDKAPNDIVGKYSNTGVAFDELLDRYSLQYVDTHMDGMSVNDFYRSIYTLFRDILNINILDAERDYTNSEIESEADKLEEKFPNGKFSIEFLNMTESLENWKDLTLEETANEYQIEVFDDKSILENQKGIPGLRVVSSSPLRSLEKDKEYMNMLNIKCRKNDSRISSLYKLIYSQRLSKLSTSDKTHKTFREITATTRINNQNFGSNGMDVFKFDSSMLKDKIREFRIEFPNLPDDGIKEELMDEIERKVNVLSSKIYSTYSKSDWNVSEMNDLFALQKINRMLKSTIKEKNGIMYAMGSPVIIDTVLVNTPGTDSSVQNSTLPNKFYVTPDGLLINSEFIIKPVHPNYRQIGMEMKTYSPGFFIKL